MGGGEGGVMEFKPLVNNIPMEGKVSQISNLGLSFYFMTKNV